METDVVTHSKETWVDLIKGLVCSNNLSDVFWLLVDDKYLGTVSL